MPASSRFIFIRHSIPEMDFSVPSSTWGLTSEGRDKSVELAPRVAEYAPIRIYTGPEPKMRQTGELIGREIGVPVEPVPGLQEHMRPVMPYRGPDEWHALIQRLFEEPDRRILGDETASACLQRFSEAVDTLAERHGDHPFAVVSGATAISLYAARRTARDGFEIWRALDMPDLLVL
ncbi:MAG: histidine phosphatase family protein [Chloroflexota bacterium]